MSLLLVIWGLFMVCSGRVPDVNIEDDFSDFETDSNESEKADLMNQLALLDDEPTNLEDAQRSEILEALGIETNGSGSRSKQEDDFLTEELFLDLEVEIAELEKMSKNKTKAIDSLRLELQEADHQINALTNLVDSPSPQFASKSISAPQYAQSNGFSTEYGLFYQDALDDVYSHKYTSAIAKFNDILKMDDKENLADNCQYWIGECYFAMGNYELAIAEFEKVFAFEVNNKADDAQFMIGMAYLKIGEKQLAEIELTNLLTYYESSEYASRAEQQLLDLNI
ncbi:MAG: tol-pal system YbgF family protein [bacterium]